MDSTPALAILNELPRIEGNAHVIVGAGAGGHLVGLDKIWWNVRARAGLNGVRIHDLRHSFAATGASGGKSLYIVGKLLGHAQAATTQRYAHLAADPVREANEAIGSAIAAAMTRKPGAVVPLRGGSMVEACGMIPGTPALVPLGPDSGSQEAVQSALQGGTVRMLGRRCAGRRGQC